MTGRPGARGATPASEAAEGLLLIEYACRLAVKNVIVVMALRPGGRYDRTAAVTAAAAELLELAEQATASADRMVEERVTARQVGGSPVHEHDYRRTDTANLLRREQAYRDIAAQVVDWSRDEPRLDRLVEAGRLAAWNEIAAAIEARLARRRPLPDAPAAGIASAVARRRVAVGLALLAIRRRRRIAPRLVREAALSVLRPDAEVEPAGGPGGAT